MKERVEISRDTNLVCFSYIGTDQKYYCSVLQWKAYEAKFALVKDGVSLKAIEAFENAAREAWIDESKYDD